MRATSEAPDASVFVFVNQKRAHGTGTPAGPAPACQPVAPAVTPVVTPAVVAPRCRSRATSETGGDPAAARRREPVVIDGITVTARLLRLIDRAGHTLDQVADAIRDPEATWPSRVGNAVVHLRGPLAVLVSHDGEAFAMSPRAQALRHRSEPREGATRRSHGGVGSTGPCTVDDLLDRAAAAGLHIERGTRHHLLSHGGTGVKVTIPATPSDHRSLANATAAVRRVLGVDLRRTGTR